MTVKTYIIQKNIKYNSREMYMFCYLLQLKKFDTSKYDKLIKIYVISAINEAYVGIQIQKLIILL